MSEVRVRIPPSPTGNLHVGTARTALFNELFARHEGGEVILRFEDTDHVRSKPEFEKNIIEGLKWLGVTWDEGPDKQGKHGPYRQSERTAIYQKEIQRLLDERKAYKEGEAIKLHVETREVEFKDEVRGAVKTHTDTWGGDFVIARSLTSPLYHLAVVVDDALMEITHVIRGEDHISNTPRQILIQEALGYSRPVYAHLPLLLDASRRKLSKRAGDTDLLAYRKYLPEAMMNYLAQLGWSPKDDREYLTRDDLIKAFTLSGIQKAGAIFSIEKLEAINKLHLRSKKEPELLNITANYSAMRGIDLPYYVSGASLATEQFRVGDLDALIVSQDIFNPAWVSQYKPELLIWKKSNKQETVRLLTMLKEKLERFSDDDFVEERLEKNLIAWIDEQKLGRGETLWPLRVALTGREKSPSPFEVAAVLGKAETLRRIEVGLGKLNPSQPPLVRGGVQKDSPPDKGDQGGF